MGPPCMGLPLGFQNGKLAKVVRCECLSWIIRGRKVGGQSCSHLKGANHPNMKVLGPKYYTQIGFWGLTPSSFFSAGQPLIRNPQIRMNEP